MNRANCYSVYDRKTDELVILDGTSKECAEAMGITIDSFYSYLCKSKKRVIRWDITESRQVERDKKTKRIVKLRHKGLSNAEISRKTKMSPELVSYYLRKIGGEQK